MVFIVRFLLSEFNLTTVIKLSLFKGQIFLWTSLTSVIYLIYFIFEYIISMISISLDYYSSWHFVPGVPGCLSPRAFTFLLQIVYLIVESLNKVNTAVINETKSIQLFPKMDCWTLTLYILLYGGLM